MKKIVTVYGVEVAAIVAFAGGTNVLERFVR